MKLLKLFLLLTHIFVVAYAQNGVLECLTNEDCLAAEATCDSNLCSCPTGKVLSVPLRKCLNIAVGIDEACEDDIQCTYLLGRSICNSDKKCDCGPGWFYNGGKCTFPKNLNEPCESDSECFNGYDFFSTMCKETCQCRDGYYNRDNYDCRPKGEKVGDLCALSIDCHFENAVCTAYKCADGTKKSGKTLPVSINITKSDTIDKATKDIGSPCSTNGCTEIANSFCSPLTSTCICKRGYYNLNGVCTPEIGSHIGCSIDKDCGNFKCHEGTCYCKNPLTPFNDRLNRKCTKTASEQQCTTKESCYIYGKNAICYNKKCTCAVNYKLSPNLICEYALCVSDADCSGFAHTKCNAATGVCECLDGFVNQQELCVAKLGGECEDNQDCRLVQNSVCTTDIGDEQKKSCACDEENNYFYEDDMNCKRIVPIGEQCTASEECSNSNPLTECLDGKCNCQSDLILHNNTCYFPKTIGSYCNSLKDCEIVMGSTIECRKSQCLCPKDYKPAENNLKCITSNGATLHEINISLIIFSIYSITTYIYI